MDDIRGGEGALARKYEAVFCIFMAVMAYLGRENAELVYPHVLYLFLVLLGLNFSAGVALRRWPARRWLAASIILGNCGAITGILYFSGGPGSNLWVLYLLPIYTVSLLLEGREVAWITGGALSFNLVFYAVWIDAWGAAAVFEISLKSGILVFAAALTWRLVSSERRSLGRLRQEREKLDRLAQDHERSQALAKVGLSSAGIVHDLKTPLMVIKGFAQLGLDVKSLDPEIRDGLEHIKRSAAACQTIVDGVLAAAKNDKPALAPCEIHEVLACAADLCEGLFRDGGIEVRKDFQGAALFVRASRERLQRVFVNLLSNAAKAMPGGGSLTLRTESDGRQVRVIVEDDGTGISDEAASKLFKPFHTTHAGSGGTGLGLYVSRQIAIEHGGGLQIERRPEGGTRAVLSLPLRCARKEDPNAIQFERSQAKNDSCR